MSLAFRPHPTLSRNHCQVHTNTEGGRGGFVVRLDLPQTHYNSVNNLEKNTFGSIVGSIERISLATHREGWHRVYSPSRAACEHEVDTPVTGPREEKPSGENLAYEI